MRHISRGALGRWQAAAQQRGACSSPISAPMPLRVSPRIFSSTSPLESPLLSEMPPSKIPTSPLETPPRDLDLEIDLELGDRSRPRRSRPPSPPSPRTCPPPSPSQAHGTKATGYTTYGKVLGAHDAKLQQQNTLLITPPMLPLVRERVAGFHQMEQQLITHLHEKCATCSCLFTHTPSCLHTLPPPPALLHIHTPPPPPLSGTARSSSCTMRTGCASRLARSLRRASPSIRTLRTTTSSSTFTPPLSLHTSSPPFTPPSSFTPSLEEYNFIEYTAVVKTTPALP